MAASGSNPFDALSQDDLQKLRLESELFARQQLNFRLWRGHYRGVPPEGHDADSLANDAIARLLTDATLANTLVTGAPRPSPDSQSLSQAETPDDANPLIALFRQAYRYTIKKEINRLYHKKENSVLLNEPDLLPPEADENFVSPVELVPSPEPDPLGVLLTADATEQTQQLKTGFLAHLGNRRGLKHVYRYLCDGIKKPAVLARKLGVSIATIKQRKKRLQAEFAAFTKHNVITPAEPRKL